MTRIFFVSLVCAALFGCAPRLGPPPTLTNTERGSAIITIEPQRTADRKDVPQGSKPRDVIVIKTQNEGTIYVDVKKKTVSLDEQAQKEVKSIAVPKRSWRWLWLLVGACALLWGIDILLGRWLGFNPIRWIVTKVRGVFK